MCKAVDDYAKELVKEEAVKCVKRMLDDGIPLEKALKYADIDIQTYEKYSNNLQ